MEIDLSEFLHTLVSASKNQALIIVSKIGHMKDCTLEDTRKGEVESLINAPCYGFRADSLNPVCQYTRQYTGTASRNR